MRMEVLYETRYSGKKFLQKCRYSICKTGCNSQNRKTSEQAVKKGINQVVC